MTLAVDIGNTTVNFGVFDRGKLVRIFKVPTHACRAAKPLARRLIALPAAQCSALSRSERVVLCSVVPWATPVVTGALRARGAGNVRVIGRDLVVPLKNRYRYPGQVGQDRLVGAYAAWTRSRGDCIVADFGTAITIDVVTKSGEYLGGMIAPGLEISLDALATRTALLPKVELREPPELLGRDTANSIRSGLIYGYAALCDGVVAELKRRYVPGATVVGTGGNSALIAKHTRTIDSLRPHLVLEGLYDLSRSSGSFPIRRSVR